MPIPDRQWSPEERAVLRETCNLIYDALVVLTDSPEQVIPDDAFAPGDLNRIVAVTESRGVSLRALIAWAEITRRLESAPTADDFLDLAAHAAVIADRRGHSDHDLDPFAVTVKIHSMPLSVADIVACGWLLHHTAE